MPFSVPLCLWGVALSRMGTARSLALAAGLLGVLLSAPPAAAGDDLIAAGRRIYLEGRLPAGAPMRGVTQAGTVLEGAQAACATCHRRSGLGTSEGGYGVLPIAGPMLFQPRDARHRDRYRRGESSQEARPAYDEASLARALRAGRDPAGRELRDPMPRYALSERDMAALAAYLRQLSSAPAPGVDDTVIHLATVVAPDADPVRRRALLNVLEAFVAVKNAQTRQEGKRARLAPWTDDNVYPAYRRWDWQVWELSGPAADWPAQLERHYARQPVFALMSGIGGGDWQPVHRFCEARALPCIFPSVDAPVISEQDYYNLYFSQGVVLEAKALAGYLKETGSKAGGRPTGGVLQVHGRDSAGMAAAQALAQALQGEAKTALVDEVLDGPLDAARWRALIQRHHPAATVLWLKDPPLDALAADGGESPIFLSSSLALTQLAAPPPALAPRLRLVHPFVLSRDWDSRLARVRTWLASRGIASLDARSESEALFAAGTVTEALKHILENYSREYFLERTEHMLENAILPALYPRVSLGAGQRYASKGSYIARFATPPDPVLAPLGDYIVP